MDKSLVERRSLLKMGAFALAGSSMPLRRLTRPNGMGAGQAAKLARVKVEPERIIRKVAGLRPFRPSGFVVGSERRGAKTIIHNYGHGGCGVTLSWGTADMAVRLALETPFRTAAVIGCGAVGLATARLLQDRGFQVTIYARDLSPNTTSNIAAAMFGVTSIVDQPHETPEITKTIQQAVRFAHRQFQVMAGEKYGVRWLPVYFIGEDPQTQPWDFAITPELYPLTQYKPGEHSFPVKHTASFPTLMIDPNTYLPQLLDDFLMRGGKLEIRAFQGLTEITRLKEPLVMNCSGYGAKALFDDHEMIALKGQLSLLLPQPEVDYAYIDGRNYIYMFPRRDGIILGGSHEKGVDTTEPDEAVAKRILEGHQRISAGMKS